MEPPEHQRTNGESRRNRTKSMNSTTSVEFESVLRKAGFGKFNYVMLLIAIPASCTSSYVTGSMSFVVPVAGADLELTPLKKALLQSAPYAGMISSAFAWGALSDSFGRQKLLAVGFLLDAAMNTACALIPYLPSILLFKFLSGAMVCGPYSIFMTYISELFLDKKRDLAILSSGIFSPVLQIFQVGVALLLIPKEVPDWIPFKSWQLFVLFCGVPSFLAGVGCALSVESPKFLIDKGKPEKALEVCKMIYSKNTGHKPDTFPVKSIHETEEGIQNHKKTSAFDKITKTASVLKPPYITRLLMVFTMQIYIASTLNMIRLWLPEMLTVITNADPETSGNATTLCPLLVAGHKAIAAGSKVVSKNEVYYDMMFVNFSSLIAQISSVVIVKYIKKKCILMGGAVISLICAASIPHVQSDYVFILSAFIIAVLSVAFFTMVSVIVEVFPTSLRATSVSLTMMVGRIGVLTENFLFANLIYSHCQYFFYGLAVSSFSIIFFIVFLVTTPIIEHSHPPKKMEEEA